MAKLVHTIATFQAMEAYGIHNLVLKSTITPLNSAQGTRTSGTPSHGKIGRGGTDRTTTGTEQMPQNPPTSRRSTGGAELSIKIDKNGHITRKKMGKM